MVGFDRFDLCYLLLAESCDVANAKCLMTCRRNSHQHIKKVYGNLLTGSTIRRREQTRLNLYINIGRKHVIFHTASIPKHQTFGLRMKSENRTTAFDAWPDFRMIFGAVNEFQ